MGVLHVVLSPEISGPHFWSSFRTGGQGTEAPSVAVASPPPPISPAPDVLTIGLHSDSHFMIL